MLDISRHSFPVKKKKEKEKTAILSPDCHGDGEEVKQSGGFCC